MSDFAALGEFAIPFANAMVKLRRASDAGEPCALDADEVKATVDGMRMLLEESRASRG